MKKALLILLPLYLMLSFDALGQEYYDEDSVLQKPMFYLSAGGYSVDMQTDLRIDGRRGIGTDISLENDLKLASNAFVFVAGGIVSLKNKSEFAFTYTSTLRSRDFEVVESFKLGDRDIDVGATANIYFNTYYYAFTWRYSIFKKPNWNAGLSLGLRAINIRTGIDAQINQRSFSDQYRVTVPSILFGVYGSAYLTPRLLGRYNFEYFQATISGIDFRVLESSASLEYFIIKNVGLGVGYNTNVYVARNIPFKDNFEGKVIYGFEGFFIKASARF
jgi:hypothetical protein